MFVPVYTASDPRRWGYSFRPESDGDEPACWAWVPDGSEVRYFHANRCEMIVEPGRAAPRFAHELWWEDRRREALPIGRTRA